ncbi:hypothetical protein TSOC_005530 [Tetrabaena socialis]|uniref:Uncharacterized protein n=1 Tax=Tetrabaena socialis TaxID=47790 RepID=A0A2J8A5Z6_9CHLO|nr:hypothetical protein TSOC_005530 [Tetrabaena socialis]|eukprot:PNH07951.1 hypothetical protein TSOC_005530 [Tetrabaena socialis]
MSHPPAPLSAEQELHLQTAFLLCSCLESPDPIGSLREKVELHNIAEYSLHDAGPVRALVALTSDAIKFGADVKSTLQVAPTVFIAFANGLRHPAHDAPGQASLANFMAPQRPCGFPGATACQVHGHALSCLDSLPLGTVFSLLGQGYKLVASGFKFGGVVAHLFATRVLLQLHQEVSLARQMGIRLNMNLGDNKAQGSAAAKLSGPGAGLEGGESEGISPTPSVSYMAKARATSSSEGSPSPTSSATSAACAGALCCQSADACRSGEGAAADEAAATTLGLAGLEPAARPLLVLGRPAAAGEGPREWPQLQHRLQLLVRLALLHLLVLEPLDELQLHLGLRRAHAAGAASAGHGTAGTHQALDFLLLGQLGVDFLLEPPLVIFLGLRSARGWRLPDAVVEAQRIILRCPPCPLLR